MSDNDIVKKSGFLNKLEAGEGINEYSCQRVTSFATCAIESLIQLNEATNQLSRKIFKLNIRQTPVCSYDYITMPIFIFASYSWS